VNRWERFCIVGLGGHARTKLIPAIEANGQSVAALVSRQLPDALPYRPVFATLDEALEALPRDTAIVITTPPALHHAQVRAAIDAGFDVVVEKPAFTTAREARDIAEQCAARGTVVVEAFMQRHSELYRRLIAHCKSRTITALDAVFVVPSMPTGTFRNADDPASSSLYDIGCYILALLADLGIGLEPLDIVGVDHAGTMAEAVDLAGDVDGIAVTARIGVDPEYRNSATVTFADDSQLSCQPLFFGRPGTRMMDDGTIKEGNAFEAMFGVSREQWLADQASRLASIVSVTEKLESLAAQLAAFRANAR
jgi:predicted dehydrogenase